jgi:hypothetical protein
MKWTEAETLIRKNIVVGMKLDNRIVLGGPNYPCNGYNYNGEKGFKIRIGTTTATFLEIPFSMLQTTYEDATANNSIYENQVFKNKYERQLKIHGCHVHVIGRIFEKAGLATQIDNRRNKII